MTSWPSAMWTNASAKAAAERWGGSPTVYTDLDRMLEDPDIDAVEILTPTHLHYDHVLAALERRKARFGPEAGDQQRDEARSLGEAAAKAGLTLRISECFVHYPPLELAKKLVSEGAIGRPTAIRIKTVVGQTDSEFQANLRPEGYGWRLDTRSPGGHLFDDMVHKFAMATVAGRPGHHLRAGGREEARLLLRALRLPVRVRGPRRFSGCWTSSTPRRCGCGPSYYGADEFFEIQGDEGIIWVTRATGEMLDLAPVMLYNGKQGDCGTVEMRDVDADWGSGFKGLPPTSWTRSSPAHLRR